MLTVPAAKTRITLRRATSKAADVVVDYDDASGTKKPDGSTYRHVGQRDRDDRRERFTASALTLRNSFDRAAHPEIAATQAVAVKTTVTGWCSTTSRSSAARTRSTPTRRRPHGRPPVLPNCAISGDVDFLFGRATAVFDRATITALDRSSNRNGYLSAASTRRSDPYGS